MYQYEAGILSFFTWDHFGIKQITVILMVNFTNKYWVH